MPLIEDHKFQAIKNVKFLESINMFQSYWDWQVTVCFYSALHLIHAHLSKHNIHFEKHKSVLNLLSPFSEEECKFNQNDFISYRTLFSLSIRSRYLSNHKENDKSANAHLTNEKHFLKALKHLDVLMDFSTKELEMKYENKYFITCVGFEDHLFKFFTNKK